MGPRIDEATAKVLQRLELLLMDPVVRRDRNHVAALLHDDFLEFGSSGRVWTRDTTLDLLSSETYTAPEVQDLLCHSLGTDVVLVTYRTIRNGERGMRIAALRSSIWMKESGSWRMRFHQGTLTSP